MEDQRYLNVKILGNQSPELRSVQPKSIWRGQIHQQLPSLPIEHGKDIMLTQPSDRVHEDRRDPVTDVLRYTFIELGFGVVNSKVPVSTTLVEAVFAFEESAFDVELQRLG